MTISELYIYPIKSLGGISVTEAIVEPKGLRHDRRFMLVSPPSDGGSGQFITQRTHTQMALIDVAIEGDQLHVWHRNRPDDVLKLPLAITEPGETIPVDIWDSMAVPAVTVSTEADQWFSGVLGQPCQLVFMPETTHRVVDQKYARDDDAVSFADGYPYLLIGQASLDDLNQRISTAGGNQSIEMRRFRPNIIVDGSLPYEEDAWKHFQINGMDFYGVKPCARCVLTTIDPETGQKGKEPLRTLTTYRRWNNKILFGQNVLSELKSDSTTARPNIIRVGQAIEVISRQEPWLSPPLSNSILIS